MNDHLLLLLVDEEPARDDPITLEAAEGDAANPIEAPMPALRCRWRLASANGVITGDDYQTLMEQVVVPGRESGSNSPRVDLVLAGSQGYVCCVTPPPRAGRRLQQVLPFLVEEHVTGDIDQYHLVPDTRTTRASGAVPVAIYPRAGLRMLIARLADAGLEPDSIRLLPSLLPANDETLTVLALDGAVHMAGPDGAVRADPEWWALAVDGQLGQGAAVRRFLVGGIALDDPELAALTVGVEGEVAVLHEGAEASEFDPLGWLAQRMEERAGIELRSGEFATARREQGSVVGRRLGLVALLLVWFGIESALAFGTGTWYERLADARRAEAVTLYRSLFPDETRVRNPRRQMEQHLLGRGASVGPSDRAEFLALLTPLAARARQAEWTSISFNRERNELNAQLQVPTLAVLESIRDELESAGFGAEIVNAVQENNRFNARLRVRTGEG